jgi:hypothetical protein
MERAAPHPEVGEHVTPAPVPRDPDLPAVSDGTLMLVAAVALVATALALLALVG